MIKKRSAQIVKGSASPQPVTQSKLYLGHKISSNPSVQGGTSFKRLKFGDGGCGCGGNVPKHLGRRTIK
ncbi:hypothetical protein C0971_07340 [Bacillus methanolicus]|uniref:hypothetical protein n=1 Tax=Bacillus methanolicus TaxID=1471 RepID=UPI00200BEBDA|nr:hypothetical protein [Bacillus methanolicus]UQD51875.1 hypothetical protein C0971_07340 [Bacillus methanolicus]